jgi:hypothetical protein
LPRLGTTRKTFGSTTRARSRSISALKAREAREITIRSQKQVSRRALISRSELVARSTPIRGDSSKKMIERYWDVEAADKEAGENEATGNNDDEETQ